MTDAFDELFEERIKTIDTRLRLNKLIALNLQLFNAIVAYAASNNIPLAFSPRILSIIKKIEEEDPDIKRNYELADGFLQRKRTDEDLTEPIKDRLIGHGIVVIECAPSRARVFITNDLS